MSRKFVDPHVVTPEADIAAHLQLIARLFPRPLHGQHGPDLECYPARCTLDK